MSEAARLPQGEARDAIDHGSSGSNVRSDMNEWCSRGGEAFFPVLSVITEWVYVGRKRVNRLQQQKMPANAGIPSR